MSEHYDFHYQPTGSGAISGQQVLEQTEDAINELGDYVNDNVGGAMDVAQQALETAQNAEQDAQTALDTANSFSGAIQSAQQDANTALSTAQTAQTTASNANNTAIQAQQDANTAVTTANNASGQVSTLSGTVTALGQRVTTAEGNIGQNTSDITALTTRVGTAEGNITTLQNDVTIAQGNASSAMATAGQVKQQAFVFRYSSTALVASSTNSNALLDNTDNLKVGDKVIDSSGVLFSVTAIDTQNSTFTIGTALIDLAQDSDVVHKSDDETVGGIKTFSSTIRSTAYPNIRMYLSDDEWNVQPASAKQSEIRFTDKNSVTVSYFAFQHRSNSTEPFRTCWRQQKMDGTSGYYSIDFNNLGNFYPENDNAIDLGVQANRWKSVYATNYYYGNDNVEFSTKFVTTDTNQTISGNKTFSSTVNVYNSDSATDTANLIFRSSKYSRGSTTELDNQYIRFLDKNAKNCGQISCYGNSSGNTLVSLFAYNTDSNNQTINSYVTLLKASSGYSSFYANSDNATSLGETNKRWSDVQTYKVNALEPSSLSLPSDRSARIDISSYFTDTSSGGLNRYTAPSNGFVYLLVTDAVTIHVLSQTSGGLTNFGDTKGRNSVGQLYAFLPVRKDDVFTCQWYTTLTNVNLSNAYFIPCQGNV